MWKSYTMRYENEWLFIPKFKQSWYNIVDIKSKGSVW